MTILKTGSKECMRHIQRSASLALYPGDRMLVQNMTPCGGSGKLRNHWEDTIHTVVPQVGEDISIYELSPEHGKGKSRVLH